MHHCEMLGSPFSRKISPFSAAWLLRFWSMNLRFCDDRRMKEMYWAKGVDCMLSIGVIDG
jgi:hypothetical protein